MIIEKVQNINTEKNIIKVTVDLENNTVEDFKNRIKKEVKMPVKIKSSYSNKNRLNYFTFFIQPVTNIATSSGLTLFSKTKNIFRNALTDQFWKKIVKNGKTKLIRLYTLKDNLALYLQADPQLKVAFSSFNPKINPANFKRGDIVVTHDNEGNIQLKTVLSSISNNSYLVLNKSGNDYKLEKNTFKTPEIIDINTYQDFLNQHKDKQEVKKLKELFNQDFKNTQNVLNLIDSPLEAERIKKIESI